MALTPFENNLVSALKKARPFVEQVQKATKGLQATGELVLIDSLLEAAENKAKRQSAPTIKPAPRCKRTPDMFKMLAGAAATGALLTVPELAHAATNAGAEVRAAVEDLLTGSTGTAIGLSLSLSGLWVWLVRQSSWGLALVVGGAAVTAFPGIYNGLAEGFKTAFAAAIDGSAGTGSAAQYESAAPTGWSGSIAQPRQAATVIPVTDTPPWQQNPAPTKTPTKTHTQAPASGPRKGGLWDSNDTGTFSAVTQQDLARQRQQQERQKQQEAREQAPQPRRAPAMEPVTQGGVTSVGGFWFKKDGETVLEHYFGGADE